MGLINAFPSAGEEIDDTKLYSTDDEASTDLADADYIPFYDSSASGKKKTLWSNIKTVLKTYFDTLYQKTLTAGNNITISSNTINATLVRDNYSTSETVIGTWIGGQTLYQKTISCGALPNTAGKSVSHGISNLGLVIDVSGFWYGGGYYGNLPFADVQKSTISASNSVSAYLDGSSIIINTSKDYTSYYGYVTLKYTKS